MKKAMIIINVIMVIIIIQLVFYTNHAIKSMQIEIENLERTIQKLEAEIAIKDRLIARQMETIRSYKNQQEFQQMLLADILNDTNFRFNNK